MTVAGNEIFFVLLIFPVCLTSHKRFRCLLSPLFIFSAIIKSPSKKGLVPQSCAAAYFLYFQSLFRVFLASTTKETYKIVNPAWHALEVITGQLVGENVISPLLSSWFQVATTVCLQSTYNGVVPNSMPADINREFYGCRQDIIYILSTYLYDNSLGETCTKSTIKTHHIYDTQSTSDYIMSVGLSQSTLLNISFERENSTFSKVRTTTKYYSLFQSAFFISMHVKIAKKANNKLIAFDINFNHRAFIFAGCIVGIIISL